MKFLFDKLADERFELQQAVLNNLRCLLSSRVMDEPAARRVSYRQDGGAFNVLSCGVTSLVDLAGDDRRAAEHYGARLRALIQHYEPRLQDPGIEVEGGDGSGPLRMQVRGKLQTDEGPRVVRFPVNLYENS